MEKQILRILRKLYRWENRYYGENQETMYSDKILSEKEKVLLSEYGWKINDIEHFSGHEETLEKLYSLKGNHLLSERRCMEAFIAGVGGSYLRGRSVLSAWACLNTIPLHAYREREEYRCCWVCGEQDREETINSSHFQYILHLGNAFSSSPQYAYLNLKYLLDQPEISPTPEDVEIFSKLLDLLRTSPVDETPGKCEKRIQGAKLLPASMHVRGILHSLAMIGVVPNRFLSLTKDSWSDWGEITICARQLHNTRGRSDMDMPWAGWNGSLKINEEIADEVFGKYLR